MTRSRLAALVGAGLCLIGCQERAFPIAKARACKRLVVLDGTTSPARILRDVNDDATLDAVIQVIKQYDDWPVARPTLRQCRTLLVEWMPDASTPLGQAEVGLGVCDIGIGHYPLNGPLSPGRVLSTEARTGLLHALGVSWPEGKRQ